MLMHSMPVKKILCLSGAALAFTALCLCGCSGSNDVAAKFGDYSITESEVTEYTDSFRAANGYSADSSWSLYLGENSLTGKTWRESAIRSLATEVLINDRAKELGIAADEDAVADRLAELKSAYGIDADDQEAWAKYLEESNTTEDEILEKYRFSDIEQQVISTDANLDEAVTDENVASYIKSNLADQVTRRYTVLNYTSAESASSALEGFKKLSGKELSKAFEEEAEKLNKESGAKYYSGDVGWDISFTIGEDIAAALLKPGEMYQKVAEDADNGTWQLYLCTGRFVFVGVSKLDDIDDKDLKDIVESGTKASVWSSIASDYLAKLIEDANIQVVEMPSGLPYDLTPYTSYEDAANAYPSK